MSLIKDALNKVQQQRGEKVTAKAEVRYAGSNRSVEAKEPARIPPAMWVLINAGVLVLILGFNHFFTRERSPASRSSEVATDTFNAAPAATPAYEPRVESAPATVRLPSPPVPAASAASPFATSSSRPTTADAAEVEYDLAGMTVVGKNTLLSISRRSDQRSFWVPIGKTVGEVTAISYNPENDDAVIRVRGRQMTIVMRNAAVFFNPVTPNSQ